MSQTLFLSTVTAEFGSLRQRLAALLQRTKKVHVRRQDDFFHHGVKTLRMLEEEIMASEFVIHVIGREPGWCPPMDQVNELLDRHPKFSQQRPDIAAACRAGTISATQWEAWLALFLGKRLISYEFPDRLEPGSSQQQHSKRLHDSDNHPKQVANDDALYDEIIGSLIGLHLLTEQDLRRPVHLPHRRSARCFEAAKNSWTSGDAACKLPPQRPATCRAEPRRSFSRPCMGWVALARRGWQWNMRGSTRSSSVRCCLSPPTHLQRCGRTSPS